MAGSSTSSGGAEPSHSVEVELKFDVDADTPLPEWSAVPSVASVAGPELRELDARYLDTADHALTRAGYALRRRTGGPDAGWHIKGPRTGDARAEWHWPLGHDDRVPDAVREALRAVTDAALEPLARIRNTRMAYFLLDTDGGVVAEFVDDEVFTTDARTGVARSWREWEVELGPASPADPSAFFAAVASAVSAAGGRAAASESKLARALGD
jgi:hypothetical protein